MSDDGNTASGVRKGGNYHRTLQTGSVLPAITVGIAVAPYAVTDVQTATPKVAAHVVMPSQCSTCPTASPSGKGGNADMFHAN